MIVRRENCVFRDVFLPLIPNRVSETAKHIHLLRVGGYSHFRLTNFVIMEPSSVYHPTALAHTRDMLQCFDSYATASNSRNFDSPMGNSFVLSPENSIAIESPQWDTYMAVADGLLWLTHITLYHV